tara:strand:+ start:691 stop:1455 length:765 start_codon:yes stop_codon:yes gene_type:complete
MPTIKYKDSKGKRIPSQSTIKANIGWGTYNLMAWRKKVDLELAEKVIENTFMGYPTYENGQPNMDLSGMLNLIRQNLQKAWEEDDPAQKAASVGTVGMGMIEANLKGTKMPHIDDYTKEIYEKAWATHENYLEWTKQVGLKVVSVEEHLVYNDLWGVTPDIIAEVNGKLSVMEVKCTKAIHPEFLVQMAAQRMAWDSNYPTNPIAGGFHVLRLPVEHQGFHYHYWGVDELNDAAYAYERAYQLYQLEKKIKKLL